MWHMGHRSLFSCHGRHCWWLVLFFLAEVKDRFRCFLNTALRPPSRGQRHLRWNQFGISEMFYFTLLPSLPIPSRGLGPLILRNIFTQRYLIGWFHWSVLEICEVCLLVLFYFFLLSIPPVFCFFGGKIYRTCNLLFSPLLSDSSVACALLSFSQSFSSSPTEALYPSHINPRSTSTALGNHRSTLHVYECDYCRQLT